jgi:hypothetical protein
VDSKISPKTAELQTVQLHAVIETSSKVTDTLEVTLLLNEFDETTKWLATKHGTAFDIELWERMRLILTPPTWSYLDEAAGALRNPASLPATKADEYKKALTGYRSNLESAHTGIWSAVAVAATMSVHARKSSPVAQERNSLEMLAEVLGTTPARDQMLEQLEQIAKDAKAGVPSVLDPALPTQSYLGMLKAVEESANVVRKQSPKTASEVAQQSAIFYDSWFVQFYLGRSTQIIALWPFLSWAMGALPLGLRKINPLRMTIEEWNLANLEQQISGRQTVISLERMGFRREAERAAVHAQPDEMIAAMLQSIRKRGYEKASVIMQPAPESLTRTWLPSEYIACKIKTFDARLPDIEAKYVLVEVSDPTIIDQITSSLVNLPTATRIALFGANPSPPNTRLAYPYIGLPLSLDDLVERLDARPASDWDPKWNAQQRP